MAELIKKLLEKGIIKESDAFSLENEVKTSNKREEEVLMEKKILSEESLFQIKSEVSGFSLKKILIDDVSLEALEFIPEESAKFYKMVPIKMSVNVLEIGMVFPEDLKAQEVLNFLSRQNLCRIFHLLILQFLPVYILLAIYKNFLF